MPIHADSCKNFSYRDTERAEKASTAGYEQPAVVFWAVI
jgi:hypothetical protein